MSNVKIVSKDEEMFNRRYGTNGNGDDDNFDAENDEFMAEVRHLAKREMVAARVEAAQESREERRMNRGGGKTVRKFREGSRD